MATKQDRAEKDFELRLKKLDWWVKFIGIGGTILGAILTVFSIINTINQNKLVKTQEELSRLQKEGLLEKRRVNMSVELSASPGLAEKTIAVGLKITNNSSREVNIATIGIRIWRHSWESGDRLEDRPDLIIFSDNSIADCPKSMCPRRTPKSLLRSENAIALASGEIQVDTYGPYSIPTTDWNQGVWIEAFVRPFEQDDGICAIKGPPSTEGGFPLFCREPYNKNCNVYCSIFNAPPLPYLPSRNSTILLHDDNSGARDKRRSAK